MQNVQNLHRRLPLENIGNHRAFFSREQKNSAALQTAFAHVFITGITLFVGWIALRESSASIPTWVGEPGAYCMRAHRRGDFALASIPVGTPPRVLKVLINLGRVDSETSSLSLFADELLRSETLSCAADRTCSDAVLLVNDTTSMQVPSVVQFRYGTFFDDEYTVARDAGAEGELRLSSNTLYELTSTHFCLRQNYSEHDLDVASHTKIEARVDEEKRIVANPRDLPDTFPASKCDTNVQLFPLESANEQTWLALTSSYLYESSTYKLEERREVVEESLSCANASNEYEIYKLDCKMDYASLCQSMPSVPFRRFAKLSLVIALNAETESLTVAFKDNVALLRLDGALTVSESTLFASLRFLVLLIVAFVVFARAERQTASAHHCIENALRIAASSETPPLLLHDHAMADAFVGVLSVFARFSVLLLQARVLIGDGHGDGVVSESIGIAASVVHFSFRNFVLSSVNTKEPPIQKLGGSMALADASVAALLSVTSTPTLQDSDRDFDSISRLFTGTLIALFVFHRSWFAFDSCVLLAQTTATDKSFDRNYSTVLWTAALLWALQTASVVFAFSRFFCVPQGFSLSRTAVGTPSTTEAAVFVVTLSATIPLVNSVLVRISRARM